MNIRVLYFAALKDQMQRAQDSCDLQPNDTPSTVAKRLLGFDTSLVFAVNEAMVPSDYLLQDGDLLAFIPPMAGG